MKNEVRPIASEPLTLEQLREMVGQPVYMENFDKRFKNGWHIIERVTEDEIVFIDCWSLKSYVKTSDVGIYFNFYAYQPAHIDREAWEPCEFCRENGRKEFAFDSAGDAITLEFGENAAAIESDSMGFIARFCPKCGRALTEEAWAELENRLGVRM